MVSLKDRVKQAHEAGFTQADLARATGKTSGAAAQWASGTTKTLRGDTAAALAKLTGWSATWWATGKGPREDSGFHAGPSAAGPEISPLEFALHVVTAQIAKCTPLQLNMIVAGLSTLPGSPSKAPGVAAEVLPILVRAGDQSGGGSTSQESRSPLMDEAA